MLRSVNRIVIMNPVRGFALGGQEYLAHPPTVVEPEAAVRWLGLPVPRDAPAFSGHMRSRATPADDAASSGCAIPSAIPPQCRAFSRSPNTADETETDSGTGNGFVAACWNWMLPGALRARVGTPSPRIRAPAGASRSEYVRLVHAAHELEDADLRRIGADDPGPTSRLSCSNAAGGSLIPRRRAWALWVLALSIPLGGAAGLA